MPINSRTFREDNFRIQKYIELSNELIRYQVTGELNQDDLWNLKKDVSQAYADLGPMEKFEVARRTSK